MKKIAVLLIALMMTLTAVALAEYEEPILFRGLEWGCSYADIGEETELKLRGLSDCESHSVAYTMSGGEDIPFNKGISCEAWAGSDALDEIRQVAGHPVVNINLTFAYTPGDDGMISKEAGHTALYSAYYVLKPDDKEAAVDDLTQKLASLYGNDWILTTNENGMVWKTWTGANGTMVALYDKGGSNNYLWIYYSFAGADDLLRNAQASNVGGL